MQPSVYQKTIETLAEAGIESPRLEARLLIADVSGVNVDDMPITPIIDDNMLENLNRNVARRIEGMPLDKILKHREFYKSDFEVSEDVMSPRPDTEILVEAALKIIKENNLKNVLDLGTGSGCILLSLLAEIKDMQGVGVDVSKKALQIAQKNTKKMRLSKRVTLIEKSWFDDGFLGSFQEPFDLIVSNPPYIETSEIEKLDISVRKYDPIVALDGGEDGLKHYRQIAEMASFLLKDGGYILLEVGYNQAEKVKQIFSDKGLVHMGTVRDLAQIDRVVIFKR